MKVRVEISSVNIGAAIFALRERLGETQEGMARHLNCTLSGFRKWESGVAIPGGAYLIKMLQMCPDQETRSLFGIEPVGYGRPEAATKVPLTSVATDSILISKPNLTRRGAGHGRIKPKYKRSVE